MILKERGLKQFDLWLFIALMPGIFSWSCLTQYYFSLYSSKPSFISRVFEFSPILGGKDSWKTEPYFCENLKHISNAKPSLLHWIPDFKVEIVRNSKERERERNFFWYLKANFKLKLPQLLGCAPLKKERPCYCVQLIKPFSQISSWLHSSLAGLTECWIV